MRRFPPELELYERCRQCLNESFKAEFDSDERVKGIIYNTDIGDYARLLSDQKSESDRIDNVLRTFMDRRYGERKESVLARFLELVAKPYPSQDSGKVELLQIVQEIRRQAAISDFDNARQMPEVEQSKRVLVVRGQNEAIGVEMFEFLDGANLSMITWSQLEASKGKEGASIDEIFQTAFAMAQAVIVVFTGDYMAKPKNASAVRGDTINGIGLQFHPDPGILFKAGIAFLMEKRRTILVALGNVKVFDPLLERHVIRLDDTDQSRRRLYKALIDASCEITSNQWMVRGHFNNSSFFN